MTDAAEILAQALNPEHWSDLRYVAHREKDIEDARAALTAVLDAVTLEWKEIGIGWSCRPPVGSGSYDIRDNGTRKRPYVLWGLHSVEDPFPDPFPAIEAAQAAALADYRARLARALGFTPASADRASDPAP